MNDFRNCTVNIHNQEGELLLSTRVLHHDKVQNHITLENIFGAAVLFDELISGNQYNVIVMCSPTPLAFNGIVRKRVENSNVVITLFKGEPRCKRKEKRHETSLPAEVEWIQSRNKSLVNKSVEAKIVNLSSRGMRLQMKKSNLSVDDKIKVKIGKADVPDVTEIVAEIRNHVDVDVPTECSEVGCQFIEIKKAK